MALPHRAGAFFVVVVTAACGGGGAASPGAAPAPTSSAAPVTAGDEARHDLPGRARVPSVKLIDRRARSALAPDTIGMVSSSARPPQSATEIYRQVAPATVIIRVPNGMGSGVIIDRAGWILTNHHVVAQGEAKDFQIKVSVTLGEISKQTGGMERREKSYDAYVHRADKLRDLALIKLEGGPAELPAVPIAATNPVPGEDVVAIGHAGAGMLWAIKDGEIAALGKLSEHLAALARFKDDKESQDAADKFKKFLDGQQLGLVIQSTCNILPGDSGGPLVNPRGEIVGLNAFSRSDPKTGGLLSFHVHVEEIRRFIEKPPLTAARMIPDPWDEGGGDAQYEDADLDGRVDVLLLEGRRPCSYCPRQSAAIFIDVDQDSYRSRALPPLVDTYEKRDFDAEVAYLQLENDAMIWYDQDNDGKFDRLLVDRGTSGRVTEAYALGANGDVSKDETDTGGRPIRASLLGEPALRARLDRIAAAAFPARYTESSAPLADTLPEPFGSTGNGAVRDLDGDGTPDAIEVSTPFSTRLLIDADHSFVKELAPYVEMSKLATSGIFDPELSIVSQGSHLWVWYDTNDDGRFDLALHSPGARLYAAAAAWTLDPGGKREAPEHVGRLLVRPALVQGAGAKGLAQVTKSGLLKLMSAHDDDAVGSFPDPVRDHRGAGYELVPAGGTKRSVVSIQAQGSDGFVIDVDQGSLKSGASGEQLAKLVSAGKVDAEFAYFQRNGLAWAYYDTANRGRYDVVLFTTNPRSGSAESGFRIDAQGATLDTSLAGAPLVRPALLQKKALRDAFAKIAPDLFSPVMIQR